MLQVWRGATGRALHALLDHGFCALQRGCQSPQGLLRELGEPGLGRLAGEEREELAWLKGGWQAAGQHQRCLLPAHVCSSRRAHSATWQQPLGQASCPWRAGLGTLAAPALPPGCTHAAAACHARLPVVP